MADNGFIQVPLDQGGKRVDTSEITREDSGVTVERQRVEARDDDDNVLSTKEIVEQLKTTNDLLFRLIILMQANAVITTVEG